MSVPFHELEVSAVTRETPECSSFELSVPAGLREAYRYRAGQHLTFQIPWADFKVTRCYSLSSCPDLGESLRIGVKRIPGGRVSNWLNDNLKVGDSVMASVPEGRFVLDPDTRARAPLFLFAGGSGITPINHLPLERYIASVVGAEMPSSWSMEALKAQAVAARSYALAHLARPANRYWHLGDTTRWQAYRGLEPVSARTRGATESTNGLILSYQGGIVESLYAANSQITLEAHGHLGASMSQEGAQQLASQGQRYNQILGHYYQGASLARLQIGGAS